MIRIYIIRLAALLCLLSFSLLLPGPLKAATTGTVQGTVKDSDGKPIKGANVTLVGTGLATVTDKSGSYLFTGVTPGTYTVKADVENYQPAETQVVLQQDMTATTDFSLAPV